jgi:hypothetical protein
MVPLPHNAKVSDQLPEEAPAEQVPDDVPQAGEGAARASARRQAREAGRGGGRSLRGSLAAWVESRLAAREASRIGGGNGQAPADPAAAPVREAGGGDAEGFEQAEEQLREHASHGDQQSAHAVLHDTGAAELDDGRADGEADHERSSETHGAD